MFSLFAIKHLPITIVAPIRATGPLWVLIGALLIFNEQLNVLQWCGVGVTRVLFFIFSTVGEFEGVDFK